MALEVFGLCEATSTYSALTQNHDSRPARNVGGGFELGRNVGEVEEEKLSILGQRGRDGDCGRRVCVKQNTVSRGCSLMRTLSGHCLEP